MKGDLIKIEKSQKKLKSSQGHLTMIKKLMRIKVKRELLKLNKLGKM